MKKATTVYMLNINVTNYDILEMCNYRARKQVVVAKAWEWGKGMDCKGSQRYLLGDGNILYLGCDGGY